MDSLLSCSPDNFNGNESSYSEVLNLEETWRQIPLINYTPLHELKDLSLVRFRGMIQDMLDPEIYLEKYEVKCSTNNTRRMQSGKYQDLLNLKTSENIDFDSSQNIHGERRTLFLVTIPGLNDWAIDYEKKSNISKNKSNAVNEPSFGQKRSISESCAEKEEAMETDETIESATTNKRIKTNEIETVNSNSNSILSAEYLLNSPIADRPSKACMVKIYDDFDKYPLNSVVDVIGFLSVNPLLDGSIEEPSDYNDINEIQAANPPPSLIPRLHAIGIRQLNNLNPLLDHYLNIQQNDHDTNMELLLYKDLKIILTQCLLGDELASEYLLSHLISTVYVRNDLETLGQFSLNLFNFPPGILTYFNQFYNILESILPASHYLPMTLKNINEKQFVPESDYETNKLKSGMLQLAPHTHLILDETKLESGKIETNGLHAIQNISSLIKSQQVGYNFKYYEIKFNTNIPVLILSEGRSLLPNNFQVPLIFDSECLKLFEETLKAAKHYLKPKLNAIRIYLTQGKLKEFTMNPNDKEMIESDFVAMRKLDPKINADSLHSLLVLSRLLGIARGKNVLDKECWEMAKDFEKQRLLRLKQIPTKS